jgi:hypothetical protein
VIQDLLTLILRFIEEQKSLYATSLEIRNFRQQQQQQQQQLSASTLKTKSSPTINVQGSPMENLEDVEDQFRQQVHGLYQNHRELLNQYQQLAIRFSKCVMSYLKTMPTVSVSRRIPDLSSFILALDFNRFYGLAQ